MATADGIPIRPTWRPPCAPRGPLHAVDGLLVVAHGSRCLRSDIEVQTVADLVGAALPYVAVEVGYLEMSDPPAGVAADGLVARGCRRVVVLPLMLLGAGHAKSDIPAVVVEARLRHSGVEFVFGQPLGVSRALVELLGSAVVSSGGAGLPLLLVARGTSDPDANAEAYKAARLMAEWTGASFVHVGFSGVTRPSVPQAAAVFGRLGYDRMAVAWWYLCHGKLIEAGRHDLAWPRFSDETESRWSTPATSAGPYRGRIGRWRAITRPAPGRWARRPVNCDTCAYRAPGRAARTESARPSASATPTWRWSTATRMPVTSARMPMHGLGAEGAADAGGLRDGGRFDRGNRGNPAEGPKGHVGKGK